MYYKCTYGAALPPLFPYTVTHGTHNQTSTNFFVLFFFFWSPFMAHFHALPHMHQALTDFMGHIFPAQFAFRAKVTLL